MKLKVLTLQFVVLLSFFTLIPQFSKAEIDAGIQDQIKVGCVKSGRSRKPVIKDLESVCACIARSHFDAALKEPLESQGMSDLDWILKFYQKRDSKEILEFSRTNTVLFEYDLDIVQSCLEEIRGK